MSVAKSFGFVLVMSIAPIGSGIGAPTADA